MVSFGQYEGPRGKALRASSRTTRTSLDPGHLREAITTISRLLLGAAIKKRHVEGRQGVPSQIPDHHAKQRVDQCIQDLKDERGYLCSSRQVLEQTSSSQQDRIAMLWTSWTRPFSSTRCCTKWLAEDCYGCNLSKDDVPACEVGLHQLPQQDEFAPHQALADRYVVVHITGMLRLCALHP